MSHKRSASTTERNKKKWTKNLVRFQESHTKRRAVPLEEQSLENNSRIPLKIKNCWPLSVPWSIPQRKERTCKGNRERSNKSMAKEIEFPKFINSSRASKTGSSAEYLR